MGTVEDRKYLKLWNQYRDNTAKATPINLSETPSEKQKRIARLEKFPEEWKKYYFPHYCTHDSAPFQKNLFKRVLKNPFKSIL